MHNPYNAPLCPYTGVPGWETLPEQNLLMVLASALDYDKDNVILEIGSEFGMSASIFAKFAPQRTRLFCVEIDDNASFMNNLAEAGLWDEKRIHWMQHSSEVAVNYWPIAYDDLPVIDLLFIDGDHSYGGALADLQNWSPFVMGNGYIVVHDCTSPANLKPHPAHFDVRKAVDEWLAHESGQLWRELFAVDSTVVFGRTQ